MRVCVVGSGGREHALAHVLSETAEVVVAPGNPGMSVGGEGHRPVGVSASPPEEVDADLFVIGPEQPLVSGLADRLRAGGRLVLGPGADGSALEGSKAWMKEVLVGAGVPTARYGVFSEVEEAVAWLRTSEAPYVVKTDGLAGGKGVLVTPSLDEAVSDASEKLSGRSFGEAGRRVVLEEPLRGEELSVLALCDGARAVPLAPAQDFKRVADGGRGPNTGGMGAYSPVALAPPEVVDEVMDVVVDPLLGALATRGIDYRGVLYAGLMITSDGPVVVEVNVRFGDPEAQVVLPRYAGDLAELLESAASGRLRGGPRWREESCVTVVMASEGYPAAPRTGEKISGVEEVEKLDGVTVFHAGTSIDARGDLVTSGGRVLDVTALGATVAEARDRAYQAVDRIHWRGAHYRRDIAFEAAGEKVTT
jgi:phosphoribosylamine---glycine ligase